jgi:hypothetical protein
MDKSAIVDLRSFLSRHGAVTKWIIAADFSVSKNRPLACFAFTIFPFQSPKEIEKETNEGLARELKQSKRLSQKSIEWLRDDKRFHLVVTLRHKRAVFLGGSGTKLQQAREFVQATVQQLRSAPANVSQDTTERIEELGAASQSRGFNVGLLTDIWILSTLLAALTTLLGRERQLHIVSWFPDRDSMTNWCGGVWHDFSFWNTRAFADEFDVDLRKTQVGVGLPDRSSGTELMWFDYLIRSADWFAGAVAEWDRKSELDPNAKHKYVQFWEDVIADAKNIAVLHLDLGKDGAQFRRIDASRFVKPPD